MKLRHVLGAASIGAMLGGCGLAPPAPPDVAVPAAWDDASITEQTLADRPWGEVFRSPELRELLREAVLANSDLAIAAQRVELARAQFGLARSVLLPELALSASATRQRQPAFDPDRNTVSESAALLLAVPSWELDLWGRVRSATEAARRELLASDENRKALTTSLVAQVASGYLRLLELDAQVATSHDTARTRRESLRLIELRFKGGVASRLEVNDATTLVAQAERSIASAERQRAQTEHALSILLGRNPGPIARTQRLEGYALPPELPAGLPSMLLARRYDLRAAEQALYAAQANVEAARLAFFPVISLSGALGLASPALRDLFDSGRYAWSASPAITVPIFNAGRLHSNLEAAEAQQRIALEQYKSAIRTAFGEVSDALVAYERLGDERVALARSVDANRERLRLSGLRYRAGVSAYFEVLDASRQLFDAELQLINVTADQYRSVIDLYRSLGGGYDPALDAERAPFPSTPLSPRAGAN